MPKKIIKPTNVSENGVLITLGENSTRTGGRLQMHFYDDATETTLRVDIDPEGLYTLGKTLDQLRKMYPFE